MPKYNGHKNWNHWNVSLWIANDENLYRFAVDCVRRAKNLNDAAREFMREFEGQKTPDGAEYSFSSVRAAISDFR